MFFSSYKLSEIYLLYFVQTETELQLKRLKI